MRAIQFVRWWWRKRDTTERVLTLIVTWLIISLATIPFMGIVSLALFLCGIMIGVFLHMLYTGAQAIRREWKRFAEQNPTQQEMLIRKLRGD